MPTDRDLSGLVPQHGISDDSELQHVRGQRETALPTNTKSHLRDGQPVQHQGHHQRICEKTVQHNAQTLLQDAIPDISPLLLMPDRSQAKADKNNYTWRRLNRIMVWFLAIHAYNSNDIHNGFSMN